MEPNEQLKMMVEQAAKAAAPFTIKKKELSVLPTEEVTEETTESIAVIPTEEVVESNRYHRKSPNPARALSAIEKSDTNVQLGLIQSLAGEILVSIKRRVKNKELNFEQEVKLFNAIKPYLGYETEGNKTAADVGMEALAIKYLEISAKAKTKSKSTLTKG